MGNSGCCAETFSAARAGASQNTNVDQNPLIDKKQESKLKKRLESALEKADNTITVLNKTCEEQGSKITDLERELNTTKITIEENEQEKDELIEELENMKLIKDEKDSKISNLESELELIKDGNYIEKQNIKIKELKLKLEKTKNYSSEKEKEQNKTITQLAKQLKKLRNINYKNKDDIYLSDNSSQDEENKYDEEQDEDLQKILFAEEYTILFDNKPFGFTFGTNKKLYKDTKNLFVKHIDKNSIAAQNALIIGSKLIKFQDEVVENLGGKKIQSLFQKKYYNNFDSIKPLKITFKKPLFANNYSKRIYELEAELENSNKIIKSLEKKINLQNDKINNLQNEINNNINLNDEIKREKEEIIKLKSELKDSKIRIQSLESENNKQKHIIGQNKLELEATKKQNENERQQLFELQSESKDKTIILSELENKNTALMDAIQELKTNLKQQKTTEEQKKYIQSKMTFIQGANVEQTKQIRILEKELLLAKNKIAHIDNKFDEKSINIIKVQKERINNLTRELTDAHIRIDELEEINNQMDRKLRKLDSQMLQKKRDKHIIYVEKGKDYSQHYNKEIKLNEIKDIYIKQEEEKKIEYKQEPVGLAAQDHEKTIKKYNLDVEKQVINWINDVVNNNNKNNKNIIVIGGGSEKLQESLKNGVILCTLANILKPKSIKKQILKSKVGQIGPMANFADKQRINEYSRVVKQIGFEMEYTFEAEDLWDGKNMTAVLYGLYAFGGFCRRNNIKNAKGGI